MSTAAAGKHALVPNLSKKLFSFGRYRLNYRHIFSVLLLCHIALRCHCETVIIVKICYIILDKIERHNEM